MKKRRPRNYQDKLNNIKRHRVYDFGLKRKLGIKFSLFLIIGFLILFIFLEFWKGFKYSIWDGESMLTFVVESNNKIFYVKADNKMNEILVLELSNNNLVELSNGYGNYKTEKIKEFAIQENENFGELLKSSMTNYFGIITKGYFVNYNKDKIDLVGLINYALIGEIKTNFTRWDLIRMQIFVSSLRSEEISYENFENTYALKIEELADESKVFIKGEDFDRYVLSELSYPEFLDSDLTWEIYNGTENNGLGATMKRIISNSGFNVIGIRQAKDYYDHSFISMRDMEDENDEIKYLATYFNMEIKSVPRFNDRADVVIVLGDDFYNEFCSK